MLLWASMKESYAKEGQRDEQIVYALRQIEGGKKVSEICREMGVSPQAVYWWKRRYVYSATIGTRSPVYVSPFVGRLDDTGVNGIDLSKNIKKMYAQSDHHVHILAASVGHLDHLLASFHLRTELATAPGRVFES